MSNKSYGCLIALLLLGLLVSLGLNVGQFLGKLDIDVGADASFSSARPKRHLHETTVESPKQSSHDKIVHIDLEGVISSASMSGLFAEAMPSVESLKNSLEQAVADTNVKAIVLRVNSPGGEVTASDISYNAVKKAAKVKPVVV